MSNALSPLAALKNKLETAKLETVMHSADSTSPTITMIVGIYNKANRVCCPDYMNGFRILVDWLTDSHSIEIDYELDRYPLQLDPDYNLAWLLIGYELQEMAKVLTPRWKWGTTSFYLMEIRRVQKAIILASI